MSEADLTIRTYAYDGIDRLTSETVAGSLRYAKTFGYDPVGNRLTQTTTGSGAASVSYAYDTRDRLTTENATTYAYDANGNVTSKSGEATYAWDFENRLANATMNAGAVVSHTYDVDGNRVQTTVTPSGGTAGITTCSWTPWDAHLAEVDLARSSQTPMQVERSPRSTFGRETSCSM